MAEQPPINALAALWPGPPNFYEAFTESNISRIETLRKAQSSSPSSSDEQPSASQIAIISNLPDDLRYLQPPEPPKDGIYRCFGDTYNVNNLYFPYTLLHTNVSQLHEALPSLEAQGIEQLYPEDPTTTDASFLLKRLSKSLLLNFLELITILSTTPGEHTEKIDDIRTLLINFHHLLNDYRPHQARESLILMMEEQLRQMNKETEGIERMKGRIGMVLEGLAEAKLKEERVEDGMKIGAEDEIGEVWKAMEEITAEV